jgi:hypothetical protein
MHDGRNKYEIYLKRHGDLFFGSCCRLLYVDYLSINSDIYKYNSEFIFEFVLKNVKY